MEVKMLAKGSYAWFEKRRKTKALELAQQQIIKALDTVALLHQSIQNLANELKKEANQRIQYLFQTEEEVDKLGREVFKEMSKHTALSADYREDILHLVKRLDTLADHVKDAARCLQILQDTHLPEELIQKTIQMTSTLVECTSALRTSIEKISSTPEEAIKHSAKVEEIEDKIDKHYVKIKRLLVTHGSKMNPGAVIIFDDLIEFIEQAADMCADTADYIITLSSRE
jgi:predicted phosphate transport protein (TIGR00153 family)